MTTVEVLLADFDVEIASTRRILERIPEDNPQWTPHPKSMPIGRLALHTARLPRLCTRLFSTPEFHMNPGSMPPLVFESRAQVLAELDQSAAEAKALVESSSEADLQHHWRMLVNGHSVFEGPRVKVYRTLFFNHLVHHRAQLTVYLRLLNVSVPGLYGPSADEQFG